MKYHFKKMMSLCKPLRAPSAWFQFSIRGLSVSCSLSVTFLSHVSKFHAIKRRSSKWGSGTPEDPCGEFKPSLLLRLCQHGPPSHSLSRSLLFWITCITADITFFFIFTLISCFQPRPRSSPSSPPSRICWRDQVDSFFTSEKKSSLWLTSRAEVRGRKRVRALTCNLFWFYLHTQTHHFLTHTTMPHVWPLGDRCCNGVAYRAVSCVAAYHESDGMWCDTVRQR